MMVPPRTRHWGLLKSKSNGKSKNSLHFPGLIGTATSLWFCFVNGVDGHALPPRSNVVMLLLILDNEAAYRDVGGQNGQGLTKLDARLGGGQA